MTIGFPIPLISKLGCTNDGAALRLDKDCNLSECSGLVRNGTLRCSKCNAAYTITGGILNLLEHIVLDVESKHEQLLRDESASLKKADDPAWWENDHESMEMIPTVEDLSPGLDKTILELGCGDGRYTVSLSGQCQWILAVDFSIESLRVLQRRLQVTQNVGLVLGDITTMKVNAACFDRVFSTLVSNLPTREHRDAMYRLASHALRPNGRFVFSTHNHGFRQKLSREPKSGRYKDGGIYRYNITVGECKAEARPFFNMVKARPIQIYLPFARRLGLPLVFLSRLLERVPLINRLGLIVLCTAKR